MARHRLGGALPLITRQHYDDPRWRAKTARSTGAREFRQVMRRLERKGTPAFVQERMAAKTGRKRVVSWAAFIRLCTLAAFHSEATFHLVDVHLAPGSTHRGLAGVEALDGMRRVLGQAPSEVMADRGYSYAKTENWAAPLFERGIRQVFDLHPNARGVNPGPIKGTQWRDGLLFVHDKVTKHEAVAARSPLESPEVKEKRAEAVAKRHAFSFGFEDWNLAKGTVRLVGPAVRGQVRCVNHPASMRLKAVKQHSRGGRRVTRPTTAHVLGEECPCGKTKVVPISDVIRFYQPYVWGSPEWEHAYGARNLSETANSNFKDHHGRFAKGSIKVLGRNKIALALAFFVDAVNTRLIINMSTDFFERWTGLRDPYLPDPDDPAWTDPDHQTPATRAGPDPASLATSPATPEPITT